VLSDEQRAQQERELQEAAAAPVPDDDDDELVRAGRRPTRRLHAAERRRRSRAPPSLSTFLPCSEAAAAIAAPSAQRLPLFSVRAAAAARGRGQRARVRWSGGGGEGRELQAPAGGASSREDGGKTVGFDYSRREETEGSRENNAFIWGRETDWGALW